MLGNVGGVRLSVVIPAYNAAKYIAECLTSVLAQEEAPPFEVIVVDDGSSDDTAEIVAREFPSVRLIRKANGGAGSARNRGVAEAHGEIIVFSDADDIMLPGRLAFQGAFMLANPRFGLTFGNQQNSDSPSNDKALHSAASQEFDFLEIEEAYSRLLVIGNFVGNVTSAVRRDAYLLCGGQPEEYSVAEDYMMNCAIARNFPIAATRGFLTWYRRGHGGNMMSSSYAYFGPVRVMKHEITEFSHLLRDVDRVAAVRRFNSIANVLLRWLWIERGRSAVLDELNTLRSLLSFKMRLKWSVMSFSPSLVGRGLRWIKRFWRTQLQPSLIR